MSLTTRACRPARRGSLCAVLALVLAACGGGDDGDDVGADGSGVDQAASDGDSSATDDGGADGAAAGDGAATATSDTTTPVVVVVDGETFEMDNVFRCDVGEAVWGADFRALSAGTGEGYPGVSVFYVPPEVDESDQTNVAFFPTSDAGHYSTDNAGVGDLEIALRADGADGSATLGAVGDVPSDDVHVEFSFTCAEGSTADDEPEIADEPEPSDDTEASDDATPPENRTGTITWAGVTTEFDLAQGDLDPMEGTGLCEVVDVIGNNDDYFRIVAYLDDGNEFYLQWDDGLAIGEIGFEEQAEDLDVTKDGRTVSGTASTSEGPIEFSFTC